LKLFECQQCGQLLFFENTRCERCGRRLGYLPERVTISALEPRGADRWRPLAGGEQTVRYCANARYDACNWLIPDDEPSAYCRACRLNRIVPDLGIPGNLVFWQRLEAAKHRLVYGLLRLELPLGGGFDGADPGPRFEFLAGSGAAFQEGPTVVTGHRNGVITIDVAEADDVERERHRRDLLEPYRTLLGHFRHEIGHYYWDRLVRSAVWHEAFRDLFGDERTDYAGALQAHYASGPQPGWQGAHISGYASAHPWEDFAETWAHYLHIVDTLETAAAFGLQVRASAGQHPRVETEIKLDPYLQPDFDLLMDGWPSLTYAVNSLNHSMGQPDLYPFVLSPTVQGKLRFVHGLIQWARAS
jgi:hypothetical protein